MKSTERKTKWESNGLQLPLLLIQDRIGQTGRGSVGEREGKERKKDSDNKEQDKRENEAERNFSQRRVVKNEWSVCARVPDYNEKKERIVGDVVRTQTHRVDLICRPFIPLQVSCPSLETERMRESDVRQLTLRSQTTQCSLQIRNQENGRAAETQRQWETASVQEGKRQPVESTHRNQQNLIERYFPLTSILATSKSSR